MAAKIFMTIWAFCLMTSCAAQKMIVISQEYKDDAIFELLWKLEPGSIQMLHSDGEYFFKTILIDLSEAESQLKGEVKTRVLLLIGEYGEYPEGKLYKIGDFLAPEVEQFELKKDHLIINIRHILNQERMLSNFKWVVEG